LQKKKSVQETYINNRHQYNLLANTALCEGTMLNSEGCLSYRMRVMKAGVKSRLDHTPKSECLTSSHVEYLMREQAGDGKAATERHLNWKHKTR